MLDSMYTNSVEDVVSESEDVGHNKGKGLTPNTYKWYFYTKKGVEFDEEGKNTGNFSFYDSTHGSGCGEFWC